MMPQYFHYRLRRREQLEKFDAWLLRLGGRRLWLLAAGIVLVLVAMYALLISLR